MASFPHLIDQRRLIGPGGSTVSGSIAFYYTGTSVLAPVYQDMALTVPSPNPVEVGAGQIVPALFLDDEIVYRRVITYSDGSIDEQDPLGSLFAESGLGLPVGAVIDFSGDTPPEGYLFCFGQSVSRTTYAELFAVIGTTYGAGNGSTTFNLPDYRGRVIAGKDNMGGSAAGRLSGLSGGVLGTSLGATGGTQIHTLTSAETPRHNHSASVTDPGHSHQITDLGISGSPSQAPTASGSLGPRPNTLSSTTGISVDVGYSGGNAGGGTDGHNNVQPTIIANKIIKATAASLLSLISLGIAPSSSDNIVTSRTALASLDVDDFKIVYLYDGNRSGFWELKTGSQPISDPLQGVYIASTTVGYHWRRVFDGVVGRPEWFGAVPGGPDCSEGINACIQVCPVTQLSYFDYWVDNTIKINKSNRILRGVGQHYVSDANEATRILTSSATLQIIQVGADSFPGSVNNYMRGPVLEDLYVGRTTGPNIASDCVGVLVQYCLGAEVSRVKSVDSIHSFRFNGTVACYIRGTNANRVVAGTGAGTDKWVGYWLDGSASIGLAGGNASIYLSETQAGCNIGSLQTGLSYGYRLTSGFQDAFLEKTESVSCNIGISIEGGTPGNADVQITHPIMDASFKWGIFIDALLAGGTVQVTDPYVGHNSSTQFSIYVNNSLGTITFNGGQILGGNFSGQGIAIVGSKGVTIDGLMLKDVASVGLGTSGTCSNLKIKTIHHNPVSSGQAAVQINGTALTASLVAPTVYGKASGFTQGIQVVGTIDNRNEYNMSCVDSGTIAGGSNNKLVRNGVQITATGLSGTNLVSGVMT